MSNPIPAATPAHSGPPWTADDIVYFYGGPLSNFAATPGLRLPFGYHGHHENDRVPVRTVEHWFQACKATSRQQFDMILACGSAPRPLAEDSPTDFVWGCRDPHGGHNGHNLLGQGLMQVREELVADVRTRLGALTSWL